jgi:hypothetical protein
VAQRDKQISSNDQHNQKEHFKVILLSLMVGERWRSDLPIQLSAHYLAAHSFDVILKSLIYQCAVG